MLNAFMGLVLGPKNIQTGDRVWLVIQNMEGKVVDHAPVASRHETPSSYVVEYGDGRKKKQISLTPEDFRTGPWNGCRWYAKAGVHTSPSSWAA